MRGGFGSFYDRYRSDVNGNGAANPPYRLQPDAEFWLSAGHPERREWRACLHRRSSASTGSGTGPSSTATASACSGNSSKDTVIDVAYVGSQSRHLPRRRNLNAISLWHDLQGGGAGPDAVRRRRHTGHGTGPARSPPGCRAGIQRPVRASGRFPAALPGLQRHHLQLLRRQLDLRLSAGLAAAALRSTPEPRRRVHVLENHDYVSDETTFTHITDPRELRLRPRQLRPPALLRGQLRLESAAGEPAPGRQLVCRAWALTTG